MARILVALAPLGLAAVLLAGAPLRADEPPPNVVLILADDQGFADYGFLGHPHIRTPRLDRLAKESLVFRRGYVPSSLCRASLASLITGLYAHQHRITSNDPPLPRGRAGGAAARDPGYRALREEMIANIERVPTLPRLLAERGYLSFQSGKWWEGNFARGGFTHGMTHGDPDRGGRHGDAGLTIGREGLGPVCEFLDAAREAEKPFFLWYAPMLPHSPHNPPERLLAHYRETAPSLEIAKYWAMCEWMDETCGELLDYLERHGLRENTLVAYVCDNGWLQDPERDAFLPRSKRSPYDGGLRTPILVSWPGRIEPGVSDAAVLSLDLAPTLLRAAGLTPPAQMPGVNLLDAEAVAARTAIYGEIFTHNAVDVAEPASSLTHRWVVAGDWKLIAPAPQNAPDERAELYRIREDPGEEHDLASERTEEVERLQGLLDAWWTGRPGG